MGSSVRHLNLRGRESLRREQRSPERDLQLQFPSRCLVCRGQRRKQNEPLLEVADRLRMRGTTGRTVTSLQPIRNGSFREPPLSQVMGYRLRLHLGHIGDLPLECIRDLAVQLLTARPQQGLVSRVADEGVFETVDCLWWRAAAKHEFGPDQLVKRILQFCITEPGDGRQKSVAKFSPDTGGGLGHLLGRGEPIEPSHQRVSQRCRDGQRRQRACEREAVVCLPQEP